MSAVVADPVTCPACGRRSRVPAVAGVPGTAAPGVAARFGARSIPTLLVLRAGVEVARQVGAPPADRLLGWVRASIG